MPAALSPTTSQVLSVTMGPPCAHGVLGTPHGEVRDICALGILGIFDGEVRNIYNFNISYLVLFNNHLIDIYSLHKYR
jgi:hypothetical protein